jgi:hypothetical protein
MFNRSVVPYVSCLIVMSSVVTLATQPAPNCNPLVVYMHARALPTAARRSVLVIVNSHCAGAFSNLLDGVGREVALQGKTRRHEQRRGTASHLPEERLSASLLKANNVITMCHGISRNCLLAWSTHNDTTQHELLLGSTVLIRSAGQTYSLFTSRWETNHDRDEYNKRQPGATVLAWTQRLVGGQLYQNLGVCARTGGDESRQYQLTV